MTISVKDEEDWSNVLNIMNAELSKDSPLNNSGVNLSTNFKIRNKPDAFAYMFLPETNVCSRKLTMPNGKEINVGLRSVGRKLTLCYLDSFVMCDIDISQSKMMNGIDSIVMCKTIYENVVAFAKKYENLVKADTAAAVTTVKGLHIYFETSDEYSPKENAYEMAQFLRQICDGNYVLKWFLDQTRGFCDKVFGTYRFDDAKEICHVKASKHVKKACNEPIFVGPKSENTQALLKFRKEFSYRILDLSCLSLDYLRIFAQDIDPAVFTHILNLGDISHPRSLTPSMKSLMKQGFNIRYIILLLASFKPRTRFIRTESTNKMFKEMQQSLTSLFYGEKSRLLSGSGDLKSGKMWGREMTTYKDLLVEKLEKNNFNKNLLDFEINLRENIYKETMRELSRKDFSDDAVRLLIVFDKHMPSLSRKPIMKNIIKHDISTEYLTATDLDFFMSPENAFLKDLPAFSVAKDMLDVTKNMTFSLTPLFKMYIKEAFGHLIFMDKINVRFKMFKALFDPKYFDLLQLSEGQTMLSKMTKMDLAELFKVWHLKDTYSDPVLGSLKLPSTSIKLFISDEDDAKIYFQVYYSFEDVKGFKKNKEMSPATEKEMDFYMLLHNAITFYCNLEKYAHIFDFQLKKNWQFVAKYEETDRLQSELNMGDLIDIGGITRDFMTSMTPRLKDLMGKEDPKAFMLIGDMIVMKLLTDPGFTLPLFDNLASYMYLLCGNAEACKCDLLIDSTYNRKGYTCETVDQMIEEGYVLDEVYAMEETLRSYLKANMESSMQDFALTILCNVIRGVKRNNGPTIYHDQNVFDEEWRSKEIDAFFDESDHVEAMELSDRVSSDGTLYILVVTALNMYDKYFWLPYDKDNLRLLLMKYTDTELVEVYSEFIKNHDREGYTNNFAKFKEELEKNKYVGFRQISDDDVKWELDVMSMLNEYVPFNFKRFLKRINPEYTFKQVSGAINRSAINRSYKAFYLTYIALSLFKETDTELYLFMFETIEIDKLDVSDLDLNVKEKHFLKVIKNHVTKKFMDFVQGNSDLTSESIIKVLDVQRNDVDNDPNYTIASEHIFKKMLQLMTETELKTVFKFATGMDSIPMSPVFRFRLVGQSYPTTWYGHTCFYSLDMSDSFKEIANKFAELLIEAYDYERARGDNDTYIIEEEFIYTTDDYDFPGKVRKEKERLIEHILISGSASQSDTCVRDSAPVVASPIRPLAHPPRAQRPERRPAPLDEPAPLRLADPIRPLAHPPRAQRPERRPAPLDEPATLDIDSSNITGRSSRRTARAQRAALATDETSSPGSITPRRLASRSQPPITRARAALAAGESSPPPGPITPRTPERPISSPSSPPPLPPRRITRPITRPVNRYDPSRRDRLESVVSSILDHYLM